MAKPAGRLQRKYRVMWNDDGGTHGLYYPPLTAERYRQIHLGYHDGSPVDCYLFPICYSGYTTTYPTKARGFAFIVDRLKQMEAMGANGNREGHKSLHCYHFAENIRRLFEQGHDPTELLLQESRRLGIDFWLHLRMNDWHHWASNEEDPERPGLPTGLNLFSSPFYEAHPEYFIGADGIAGYKGEHPPTAMRWFQDFAHQEVRQVRLEVMVEACERYDVDGFQYDFMRIPGYFKIGQERANAHLITDLIRESRAELDRIGEQRGKYLGFAVRVPSTIAGAQAIGLDVPTWINEGLVDIVVPSCFYCTDFGVDMQEWVELTQNTPVWIYPGLEEAYWAGYTGEADVDFLWGGQGAKRLRLSDEMINALAANHWASGVDGLYLFNWHCKSWEGDRLNLNNLGDPLRVKYRDKLYPLTRRDGQYEYCDLQVGPLPAQLGQEPLVMQMRIADDLAEAGTRLESCELWVHLVNTSAEDYIEVKVNGHVLECGNPLEPRTMHAPVWLQYPLAPEQVRQGYNEISLRVVSRDLPRVLQEEMPIEVADVELKIRYYFPNGKGREPRGYRPRT